MAEKFYFDNFQIPQTGPVETETVRTDSKIPIRRPSNMKISNFGALNVGAVMASDYTRIGLGFAAKDNSSDWGAIKPVWQFAEKNQNPHVAGSSIKYTRDDQFIRMGMSSIDGGQVDQPRFDVMDTNVITAEGMIAFSNYTLKNWPSEGFRTFGGKYDFLPYIG